MSKECKLVNLGASNKFVHVKICNGDLVGVMVEQRTVYLDRRLYVEFNVMDISRYEMFSFRYDDSIVRKYELRICLFRTDKPTYSF